MDSVQTPASIVNYNIARDHFFSKVSEFWHLNWVLFTRYNLVFSLRPKECT